MWDINHSCSRLNLAPKCNPQPWEILWYCLGLHPNGCLLKWAKLGLDICPTTMRRCLFLQINNMVTWDIGVHTSWPNFAQNASHSPGRSYDTVLASTPFHTYSNGQSWVSTSVQLVWEVMYCVKETIWWCEISSFIILDQIWPQNSNHSPEGSSGTVLASTPLGTYSNGQRWASISFQLVQD